MRIKVYKSLDRSVSFFGLHGRYLAPAVAGAVVALLTGFVVGGLTNGLIGLLVFLVLAAGAMMGVMSLQGQIREKDMMKKIQMLKCPKFIRQMPRPLIPRPEPRERRETNQ